MENTLTDDAVLAQLGQRVADRRVARNWTQARLAREAGISKRTLGRLEAGESTQVTNLIRVFRALGLLDALGAAIPAVEPGPVALLEREAGRVRASPERDVEPSSWEWGDE